MKEIIQSRQNPLVKTVYSLLDKKHRRAMKLFRFDGVKLFSEALLCGVDIKHVVVSEGASEACRRAVDTAIQSGALSDDKVIWVSESVFDKLSEERSPEGIITVASQLSHVAELKGAEALLEEIAPGEPILLAEALRDPGNLGTVIRSCAALGIEALVLSADCADMYNPKTVRAAMGGLFRLRIYILPEGGMPSAIVGLKNTGRGVYAAALSRDSVDISKLTLKAGDCFVIGNEGHGLSDEVIKACSGSCIIPMRAGCESLNASAAAAICIWETVKVH